MPCQSLKVRFACKSGILGLCLCINSNERNFLFQIHITVDITDAKVVDSWVGKYAGTVSWFSPGSYDKRPPLEGAGNDVLPNVKCAGDWVRMGEKEHGAKGLCQERAYVSGIEAANSLLECTADVKTVKKVLLVRDDEVQFQFGVALNKKVMQILPRWWLR